MADMLTDLLVDHAGDAVADWEHDDDVPEPPLAPEPAPVPEPAALVPVAGGGQMTRRQQVFAAIRQAFRQARRNWEAAKKRPGGPVHWFENYQPESVAQMTAYRDSRAWVPSGHEGGTADEVGKFYYSTIGPWGKRVCNFGSWVFERQFRFYVALSLTGLTAGVAVYALTH